MKSGHVRFCRIEISELIVDLANKSSDVSVGPCYVKKFSKFGESASRIFCRNDYLETEPLRDGTLERHPWIKMTLFNNACLQGVIVQRKQIFPAFGWPIF